MDMLLNIILYIGIGYVAVWITLFFHEFSHAFLGWLFGVCKSPLSIGYLPVVKLPMTRLINEDKIKKIENYKQILIHSGGLLMNLLMSLLLGLIIISNPFTFNFYIRGFILLFIVSNFAELESYITFGAIKPISDVKFILQVSQKRNYMIYIPGLILLILGIYALNTYILQENEFGYLIFGAIFYIVACSSRIILTRPNSKI
jgi:hypothetical protein